MYSIGLVLGGGGVRGFAHLGVIIALQEAGINPDIISGTSAGSIVGLMLAAGKTPQECLDFFRFSKILKITRPVISKKGILSLDQLEKNLEEFIGVRQFHELKIPLVATASNIQTGEVVHFETGDAISSVIASCSIPVVFQPYKINDIEYVDGGVFMNLPARPIRERCRTIISVEINTISRSEPLKNMIDIASRSFNLGIKQNTRPDRRVSDIVIAPKNLAEYSLLDLSQKDTILEIGYNAGKKALKKIQLVLDEHKQISCE